MGEGVERQGRDMLTREEVGVIRHFASEPCECPDVVKLIKDERPKLACGPCKARQWVEDGMRLAEELS
jgi:hypothetical protein